MDNMVSSAKRAALAISIFLLFSTASAAHALDLSYGAKGEFLFTDLRGGLAELEEYNDRDGIGFALWGIPTGKHE
jgi:hypothetical protein